MNNTKNGGNAKAATAPATWHARFDAIIKAAKGDLGGPVPAAAWQAAPMLGAKKRTSGDAAEALMIALILRPTGITTNQYQNIRVAAGQGTGLSNNCIAYLQAPGVHPRGKFGHITRTVINEVQHAHLTAKGAAHLKAAGMNARDVASLSRAPKAAPATPKAKAKAPAKAKPRKPVTPAKPQPQPVPAQAKPTVPVGTATAQSPNWPGAGNAGKPQA